MNEDILYVQYMSQETYVIPLNSADILRSCCAARREASMHSP